jgi:prepilin-type processing-associated H-X9-DG protein
MPKPRFTVVDTVALAVACFMLVALGVPTVMNARSLANPVHCQSNLKQIGLAILLYSNKNRGAYPRTRADVEPTSWTAYSRPLAPDPFQADGPVENDVTAPLFLLLRTQELSPDVFICPWASKLSWWDFGGEGRTATDCSNFPSGRHLSYSYVNPYPNPAAMKAGYRLNNSVDAEFAVMADMNPGGIDLLQVNADSPPDVMRRVNSRNHNQGVSQNVLFGDGHVEILHTPFVGVRRDNIYTFGKSGATSGGEGIVGSPIEAGDTVLLPVASFDPGSLPLPPSKWWPWPAYVWIILVGAAAFVAVKVMARHFRITRRTAA